MAKVWIGYEQMELLREYGVRMRVSVTKIIADAVDQWLKCGAPEKLKVQGLPAPNAGSLKEIEARIRILEGMIALSEDGPKPGAKLSPNPRRRKMSAASEAADSPYSPRTGGS